MTTNPAIRQNAAALGEKIRQEDDVASTIALIERMGTREARVPARV